VVDWRWRVVHDDHLELPGPGRLALSAATVRARASWRRYVGMTTEILVSEPPVRGARV
jgi:hypothetical protein